MILLSVILTTLSTLLIKIIRLTTINETKDNIINLLLGLIWEDINIKIIESGSPVYCKSCKKIVFRKYCDCNNFIDISASYIRNIKNKNLKKIFTNF
mgnify:CR=1 FL=1